MIEKKKGKQTWPISLSPSVTSTASLTSSSVLKHFVKTKSPTLETNDNKILIQIQALSFMDHCVYTHPDNHPHHFLWQYHLFQGCQVHHTTSLIWDPLIINRESKAISKTGKKMLETRFSKTVSNRDHGHNINNSRVSNYGHIGHTYCNFPQYQIWCQNHFTATI